MFIVLTQENKEEIRIKPNFKKPQLQCLPFDLVYVCNRKLVFIWLQNKVCPTHVWVSRRPPSVVSSGCDEDSVWVWALSAGKPFSERIHLQTVQWGD